jgi:glutaredoxin
MVTKIKLFTSSKMKDCPGCNMAKQFFLNQSIEFEEIDVVTNREERRRIFKKTHSFAVPIVEIGDDFFIGFDAKNSFLIIESLKKHGLWKQKTVVNLQSDLKKNLINNNKIIWITTYPRSGTGWVRSFLASYYFTENGEFFYKLLEKTPHFLTEKFFGKYKSKIDEKKERIVEYWSRIQQQMEWTHGNPDLNFEFITTHNKNGTLNDNLFIDATKTTGYINIIRDPRDVVVSYARYMEVSIDDSIDHITTDGLNILEENDFPEFRLNWYKNYMSWKEQGEKDGYPGIVVRYEDLLQDSFKYFSKIIKFLTDVVGCGIYDEDKIKKCIESTSYSKLVKMNEKFGYPMSKEYFKHQDWKDILTKEQRKRIEKKFHKEMLEFGYEI